MPRKSTGFFVRYVSLYSPKIARFPVSSYSTDADYSSRFDVTYHPLAYRSAEKKEGKTERYLSVAYEIYRMLWDTSERIDKKANP
ncbi:hypothetical protein [Enterobacter hormaechei]|uniref:hypothetical protein n=1 Tax=Enterobacter hormaechei TaxID=158836 RepID=UPI001CD93E99|nr:hypothetical protein [Enterobacter hormaechei]